MCDQMICDTLTSWGFPEMINLFYHENIDHEKFLKLDVSSPIIQAISCEDKRNLFKYKLLLHQGLQHQMMPIEIATTTSGVEPVELDQADQSHQVKKPRLEGSGEIIQSIEEIDLIVTTKDPADDDNILSNLDSLDLEGLIKKTNVGQWILLEYRNKVLPGNARAVLVDNIIRSLVEIPISSSKGKIEVPELKNYHFEILTRKFCSIFIKEDPRTYLILPKTGGKNQTTAKGKFVDKYRNWRTAQKKLGLIGRKINLDSDDENEENLIDNDPTPPNEHILWLENNNSPWRSVIHHWHLSAEYRLPQFKRQLGTVHDIFQAYPVLKQPSGHELIDIDFTYEQGREGVFYIQWPELSKKLYALMQTEIRDPESKQVLQSISSSSVSEGEKNLKLLMLLPALCPPVCRIRKPGTNTKSTWKPSILDSQASFILHVKIFGDIEKAVRDVRNKYLTFGIQLQPFIIVVGPTLSDITGFYVNIDDTRYRFESILAAVDLCFKSFHVFHAEYPKASEQVWLFLQKVVYNLKTKWDKNISSVATLLAAIKQ